MIKKILVFVGITIIILLIDLSNVLFNYESTIGLILFFLLLLIGINIVAELIYFKDETKIQTPKTPYILNKSVEPLSKNNPGFSSELLKLERIIEEVKKSASLENYGSLPLLPQPTKKELIIKLLTPDKLDGLIIFLSLISAFYLDKPENLQACFSGEFIFAFGISMITFNFFRWGYYGIYHYLSVQKKIMEKLEFPNNGDTPLYVIDFALFGLLLSILVTIIGASLMGSSV